MKLIAFVLLVLPTLAFFPAAQAETVATIQAATVTVQDASAAEFHGAFRTYVASSLDPENSSPALSLEPFLAVSLPSETTLTFVTNLDRPFNKYENFEVPRLRLRGNQKLALTDDLNTAIEATVNALDAHRWNADGAMVRTSFSVVVSKKLFDQKLLLYAKAGPLYQFNSYEQYTNGSAKPHYGFSEVVGAEFKTGRTLISAELSFGQIHHAVWKNTFAATQEVAYSFTDEWSAGVSHALLGSFIDETTGRYSSLKFFDNRQSRVSAFMGYEF